MSEPTAHCGGKDPHRWHVWKSTRPVKTWLTNDEWTWNRLCPGIAAPEEVVEALVVTSWRCRGCGSEQDVWGEGAIYSWMECSDCGVESYLVM